MTKIQVFTDGSGMTADKPAGWAYVIVIDDVQVEEKNGYIEKGTNNDAELEAIIQGLASILKKRLENPSLFENYDLTVTSDSQIALGWTNGTYRFKQSSKQSKYDQLQYLTKALVVKTQWVKGHAGNPHNERCDKLANEARKSLLPQEQKKTPKNTEGQMCIWYKGTLKIVDFERKVVEDYSKDVHGKRSSNLEFK